MSEDPLFPHIRKAWPFGCLTVGLLASGIGSIVLLGSVLGTCNPSIGCAETHILASLGWALLIASSFAAPIWLVYPSAGTFTTNLFLTFVVFLTVLLCFSPAVYLLFKIDR